MTKYLTNIKCHDCEFVGAEDYFTLRDFGNYDIDYICDPCLAGYAKENVDQDAFLLSQAWLRNKVDKAGRPIFHHCQRVAKSLDPNDPELQAIGLLHDIVEETPLTIQQLQVKGFSKRITDAVECLTHRRGEDYFDYIRRVMTNPDAVKVKIADLADNMDLSRIPKVSEQDLERQAKYRKAKQMLIYRETLRFQPDAATLMGFIGCVFCMMALFGLAVMFGGSK